jgi:hypothetical protein
MTITISQERFDTVQQKQEWIKQMRLMFCIRKQFPETNQIIHPDGSLNQEYFQPPKGVIVQEPPTRVWDQNCRSLLIKGISNHGIGQFRKISEEFLPDWTAQELRLKTIRLIGRQNLQLYKNWKGMFCLMLGNEADIIREFEFNKEIGLEFQSWKGNVLVYDDEGLVLEAIKARKKLKQ